MKKMFFIYLLFLINLPIAFAQSENSCESETVKYEQCEFKLESSNDGDEVKSSFTDDDHYGKASATCKNGIFFVEEVGCDFKPAEATNIDCSGVPSNLWFSEGKSCYHENKERVIKNGEFAKINSDTGSGYIEYSCNRGYLVVSESNCGGSAKTSELMNSSAMTTFAASGDPDSQFVCQQDNVFTSFDGMPKAVDASDCSSACSSFSDGNGFDYVSSVNNEGYECSCNCKFDISYDDDVEVEECKGMLLGTRTQAILSGVPFLCLNDYCYKNECTDNISGNDSLCKTCKIDNLTVQNSNSYTSGDINSCTVSLASIFSGTVKNQQFLNENFHGQISASCMNGVLDVESADCFKTCVGEEIIWGDKSQGGNFSDYLEIDKSIACKDVIPQGNYRNEDRTKILTSQTNSGNAIYLCDGRTGKWVSDREDCKLSCPSTIMWPDNTGGKVTKQYSREGELKGYDPFLDKTDPKDPDNYACKASVSTNQRVNGNVVSVESTGFNKGNGTFTCNDGYWELDEGQEWSCEIGCRGETPSGTITDPNTGRTCDFPETNAENNIFDHDRVTDKIRNIDNFNKGYSTYRCNDGKWDLEEVSCQPKECSGNATWGDGNCEVSMSADVCEDGEAGCNETHDAEITDYDPAGSYTGSAAFKCISDSNVDEFGTWRLTNTPTPECFLSQDGKCGNLSINDDCERGDPIFEGYTQATVYRWVQDSNQDSWESETPISKTNYREVEKIVDGRFRSTLDYITYNSSGNKIKESTVCNSSNTGNEFISVVGDFECLDGVCANVSQSYECKLTQDGSTLKNWSCTGTGLGESSSLCTGEPNAANCSVCGNTQSNKCLRNDYNGDLSISGNNITWSCGESTDNCSVKNCSAPTPQCGGTIGSCTNGSTFQGFTSGVSASEATWTCGLNGFETSCKQQKPIDNPSCGSNHNKIFSNMTQSQGDCSNGTQVLGSFSNNTNSWSWSCQTENTNYVREPNNPINCNAQKTPVCGETFDSCERGERINCTNAGGFNSNEYCWSCEVSTPIESNSKSCSATKVNNTGSCGAATNGVYENAPSSDLCNIGQPSNVSLVDGNWQWDCKVANIDPWDNNQPVTCEAQYQESLSCSIENGVNEYLHVRKSKLSQTEEYIEDELKIYYEGSNIYTYTHRESCNPQSLCNGYPDEIVSTGVNVDSSGLEAVLIYNGKKIEVGDQQYVVHDPDSEIGTFRTTMGSELCKKSNSEPVQGCDLTWQVESNENLYNCNINQGTCPSSSSSIIGDACYSENGRKNYYLGSGSGGEYFVREVTCSCE